MKKLLLGTMMASFFVAGVHARVAVSEAIENKVRKIFSKDNISAETDAYNEVKKGKVLTEAEIKTLNTAVSDISEQADFIFQSLKKKEIEKHLKVTRRCVDTIVNFAKSAAKKTTVDENTDRKIRNAVGGIKANTKHLIKKYPELFRPFREHATAAGDVLNQLSRRNRNNEVLRKFVDVSGEIELFLNEELKNSLKKQESEPNIWGKLSVHQSGETVDDDEFFDAKTEESSSQQSSVSAENISEQQPVSRLGEAADDEFFDAENQEWPPKEKVEKSSRRTVSKSEQTANVQKNKSLRRSNAYIFGTTGTTYVSH
ncbi:MAG: hypothetical protein J5821_02950 [Alphaproteobacteria bacterium]|nr:hypothetical protein [Alphaproteobacteria bacterium]